MRGRVWKRMLSGAFFSFQSAVIVALSIALFGLGYRPFEWWQAAYWLIFGALAEVAYLGATISDPKTARRAAAAVLAESYDPAAIQDPSARDRLKRALEYRRLIAEAAARHSGAMRQHIDATASQVNDWIEQIYILARQLDTFRQNDVILRDWRTVPLDLENLRRRLKKEESPAVRAELEEAIQTKETQLAHLRSLENSLKRADIQLDHTLSALGTVYAQVQLIDAKDVDSARAQRLQGEIRDEILSLQDTIAAIDEVQSVHRHAVGS